MAQIKTHKERKTKKSKAKAKACLFVVVSTIIFTRIMSFKSTKKSLGLSEERIWRR